ncbi:MAG: hypothetical protein PF501_08290 [Salinisphaera sp.]|jgi:gas vesicle protein|nr:hypothetical protein [Salinisphaera sp.]
MSIEVIAALIGAGSALIGTIVGGAVSLFATKAQFKAASRQIEVDQLRRTESSLEALLQEWMSMKVDVSGAVKVDQIWSRYTDMFLSRVQLFMASAHHFPQGLEDELSSLSNELNQYIFTSKTGGIIDNDSAQKAVRRMQKLDAEVSQRIREKLRHIQNDVSVLLQDK